MSNVTRGIELTRELLMLNFLRRLSVATCILVMASSFAFAQSAPRAKTRDGMLQGKTDGKVNTFLGIPYAAPPVGNLRWKPPRPPAKWSGVRMTTEFGYHCMQGTVYGPPDFPDPGPSEDCLFLNVWVPLAHESAKLPVMVWIHGGGLAAGAGSGRAANGYNLATRGVIVVTLNYRLGIWGFLVHPELAKESGHNSAGNYGLMDQAAALRWVHDNIASFGGDPRNVTIFGESAGAQSVNAQMASPLARGLFRKAIAESGSVFGAGGSDLMSARAESDPKLVKEKLGVSTLAELRAVPAEQLLKTFGDAPVAFKFQNVAADGYFLPEPVAAIFAAGKQNDVPLLVGWNHDEANVFFARTTPAPTADWMKERAKKDFGDKADALLKLYPIDTDELMRRSALDYTSDTWISLLTWYWPEAQIKTGKQPVYRFRFDQGPIPKDPKAPHLGAYHSVEVQYVFGNLDANKNMEWTSADRQVSDIMQRYWTNFAKNGNPNGASLASWPLYNAADGYQVMYLTPEPQARKDDQRERYLFLSKELKTK